MKISIKGQTLWIVFHTYQNGHQIEPYEQEDDAREHAAQLIVDYINQMPEANRSPEHRRALEAWDRDDFKAILKIRVPEIDDRCNVEIESYLIQ